jgi:hypothetical protein
MACAMITGRRIRLWALVVDHAEGGAVSVTHVCSAVLSAAGVDGAAVALVLGATPREMVVAQGGVAADLEELTLTLGEGPFIDAGVDGPVLVADLTAAEWTARWPTFAPAAVELGVRAAFAIPLQVGGIRLGVLDLSRASPGGLDPSRLNDAFVLADTACGLLLDAAALDQPNRDAAALDQPNREAAECDRPNQEAAECDRPSSIAYWPVGAALQHPEVHQATGMITVQLGVTAAVALVRLRAYSYANDRRLSDVAVDVVAKRLRFDADAGGVSKPAPTDRTAL